MRRKDRVRGQYAFLLRSTQGSGKRDVCVDDKQQRARWSNLPPALVLGGIALKDMTTGATRRRNELVASALSKKG